MKLDTLPIFDGFEYGVMIFGGLCEEVWAVWVVQVVGIIFGE